MNIKTLLLVAGMAVGLTVPAAQTMRQKVLTPTDPIEHLTLLLIGTVMAGVALAQHDNLSVKNSTPVAGFALLGLSNLITNNGKSDDLTEAMSALGQLAIGAGILGIASHLASTKPATPQERNFAGIILPITTMTAIGCYLYWYAGPLWRELAK